MNAVIITKIFIRRSQCNSPLTLLDSLFFGILGLDLVDCSVQAELHGLLLSADKLKAVCQKQVLLQLVGDQLLLLEPCVNARRERVHVVTDSLEAVAHFSLQGAPLTEHSAVVGVQLVQRVLLVQHFGANFQHSHNITLRGKF